MKNLLLLSLAMLGLFAENANAQAYCALRDPVSRLYGLFSEADSYRSYVNTIDEGTREKIAERLPFTLHFNELGRHTLYSPMRDGVPHGFVHVRSERGRWGLVEILWGFDFDMRVSGFTLQRCRSRARGTVEKGAFHDMIVGRNFSELRSLLSEDGQSIRPGVLPHGVDAQLALAVLRCGLKTIAATEAAWPREVGINMARARAFESYGTKAVTDLFGWGKELFRKDRALADQLAEQRIEPDGVSVYRISSGGPSKLGLLLRTPWRLGEHDITLWWHFQRGKLITVDCEGGWPDGELAGLFEASRARAAIKDNCSTPVELSTWAVRSLAQQLTGK